MKKIIYIIFILSVLTLSACMPMSGAENEPEPDKAEYISVVALGDYLMHMPLVESGRQSDGSYDYSHIFTELQPYITDADIAVIGQETIFAGKEKGYSGYPFFNTPSDAGKTLVNEGFDVVLHASNHVMDKGVDGIENTIQFWNEYPQVKILGINESAKDASVIKTYVKDGISLGLLNYTYDTNGLPVPADKKYMVNVIDEEKIKRDAHLAEKGTDFTIAFMHWGEENFTEPSSEQKELAQKMCDWGVDLIIGSHPHVVQGAEWLEGKEGNKTLVYYSLGNFVSRQLEAKNLLGGIADINLKIQNGEVSIGEASLKPVVTHYNKGSTDFCVYPLEEYTEEQAKTHGIIGYGKKWSVETLEEILYNTFEGFDKKLIDYK